ncbi:Uncharacterized protein TCM_012922 [Theobroma cacao]|uniref:Uncharacterized protein n=1 Tax=Theobroma cacao TaxID=3641 RepID=A0A061FX14_THECC|nr:Uncharacterized protein TCM_012922 [Theobroma cacao]
MQQWLSFGVKAGNSKVWFFPIVWKSYERRSFLFVQCIQFYQLEVEMGGSCIEQKQQLSKSFTCSSKELRKRLAR